MSKRHVWLDNERTSKWDRDPVSGNPVRGEQLDVLLTLIADHHIPDSIILDAGSGSGLVEEELFRRLPQAFVVGIDYSPAMMAMAEERLAGKKQQFFSVRHDLCDIESARIPQGNYQIAFSVQTIHNLPRERQPHVISWIYKVLSSPGFFFFLDRVAVPGEELFSCYQSVWKKQNSAYSASIQEGDTFLEHQRYLEREGDSPLTLQEYMRIIADAGFQAGVLDVRGNRALIACAK
jgi:tRNA (cmo5U34)-methyltransferase